MEKMLLCKCMFAPTFALPYNPTATLTMDTQPGTTSPVTSELVTPKEMIWKHIKDPEHKITEEEFSKLIIGLQVEVKELRS